MGTAPQQPSPRPTLEELLRFKRAERPAPEFWAEFDRGLRQKQLAALVKRPQGWARVRPGFARSLRWIAPTTAAAAVALVVVQMPLSTALRTTPTTVVALPARATPASEVSMAEAPAQSMAVTVVQPVASVAAAMSVADEPATSAGALAVAASEPRSERFLPWSVVSGTGAPAVVSSPAGSYAVQPVAREVRRPRSSWTSRYSEMVQEISAEQSADRVLQLASLDLSSTSDNASAMALANSEPVAYAPSIHSGRTMRDRDFRDMESRMGSSSGSGLAIRF